MKKKVLKDYSDMCIFDLMKVPTDELKELTIEEFGNEIRTKRVNIHPFADANNTDIHGNIYITGMDATIHIKNSDDENRMSIFGWDSHLLIDISEHFIFGIYSYGNDKNYRIAFEGNSPDLLISSWNRDDDKTQIIQADIRALIQKCEHDKYYEPKNIEMLTKTIEELKKLLD